MENKIKKQLTREEIFQAYIEKSIDNLKIYTQGIGITKETKELCENQLEVFENVKQQFAEIFVGTDELPHELQVIKADPQAVNFTESELKYIKMMVADKYGELEWKAITDEAYKKDTEIARNTLKEALEKLSKISL